MNDTHWNYNETFPENFEDSEYEEMQLRGLGKH
jgi:hypothetical protein